MRRRAPIAWVAPVVLPLFIGAACSARPATPEPTVRLPGHTTHQLIGEATPEVPTDFDPPPPLAEPLPGDPRVPGADYLEGAGARIGPRWSSFLEDLRLRLPPHHALNQTRLSTALTFVVASDGTLDEIAVATASGEPDFDRAALEVLADAAPLPPPPSAVLGDDGLARLRWLFARDSRQAGVATAALAPTRWSPERAVPLLLERGEHRDAASRLGSAADVGALTDDVRVALTTRVALAVLRRAIDAASPTVAGDAMGAAAELPVRALALPIATIAQARGGVARRAAFVALASLGGAEVSAIARRAALDPDSPDDVVTAAARTWGVASASANARDGRDPASEVAALLATDDPERRRRAFLIAGAIAVPRAFDAASALVDGGGASLGVPVLARLALAKHRKASARCVAGLGATGADTRLRFARELGRTPSSAPPTGALRRALSRLSRDPDERVRAASIAAMGPAAVLAAARAWRREASPLVLTALARELAAARGRRATAELGRLTSSPHASVRAAAALGLWGRSGAARWLAPLRRDADPVVREAALPAAPAAELRARAQQKGAGRAAALAALLITEKTPDPRLTADVMTAADEAERLSAAMTWLRAQNRATLQP